MLQPLKATRSRDHPKVKVAVVSFYAFWYLSRHRHKTVCDAFANKPISNLNSEVQSHCPDCPKRGNQNDYCGPSCCSTYPLYVFYRSQCSALSEAFDENLFGVESRSLRIYSTGSVFRFHADPVELMHYSFNSRSCPASSNHCSQRRSPVFPSVFLQE